jgi:hypothetical protein
MSKKPAFHKKIVELSELYEFYISDGKYKQAEAILRLIEELN